MSIKQRGLVQSKSKGFTLIELLVVIAIIGLLASIILASLDSARKKGRDARRIADVKQIQLALELYYDANNSYPVLGTIGAIPSSLAPTYISTIPTDPTNSGSYIYQYQSLASDGTTACSSASCPNYLVVAQLESADNKSTYTAATVGGSTTVCPTSRPSAAPYPFCAHS